MLQNLLSLDARIVCGLILLVFILSLPHHNFQQTLVIGLKLGSYNFCMQFFVVYYIIYSNTFRWFQALHHLLTLYFESKEVELLNLIV